MSRSLEFWSSIELGTFARGLLAHLRAAGWEARQRFAVDEITYRQAATLGQRCRVRWNSYLAYAWQLHRRLRGEPPPDAIVVCTNTFYAPAVAIHAAHRLGIPIVHWVFDLFPDVLVQSGTLTPGGWAERSLRRLTRSTFARAGANVFLGDQLLAHAVELYGDVPHAVVIPVGANGEPFRAVPPGPRAPGAPVRVLYCGNLGRMHETKTIVDLLRLGRPSGWSMEFRGHGAGFRSLAGELATLDVGNAVALGDSLADGQWAEAMLAADIALVTMNAGAEGMVMPSKTYSAMVAGQAILAICSPRSDLAETVRRHDAGWVIEPGDVARLGEVLRGAVARPEEVLVKRLNAFRAGHAFYDQRVLAARWIDLLTPLTAAREESSLPASSSSSLAR